MSQLELLLLQLVNELCGEFSGLSWGAIHDSGNACFTVLYQHDSSRKLGPFGRTQYSLWLSTSGSGELELGLWDDLAAEGRKTALTVLLKSQPTFYSDKWAYRAPLSQPNCLEGLFAAVSEVGIASSVQRWHRAELGFPELE